jgi:hypothetical protein
MKRKIIFVLALIVVVGGWYLFRPERLFIATTVNESFPASNSATADTQTSLIAEGEFHGVAHPATGKASVYSLQNGRKVLRFSNFETSNGPDVNVYLVAADDSADNDTVKNAGFVSLGPIKGTKGDQNYEIPSNVNLNQYRSVTIWCKRFGVNFATAPLIMQSANMQPVVLKSGTFHKVAHNARGTATIYQLADGKKILRFADFETSNGPDVQIYLVAAEDATDSETVKQAGFVSLGPIKGTKGDQNYELPSDLNINQYGSVTVWCKRFGVNFATAPLTKS